MKKISIALILSTLCISAVAEESPGTSGFQFLKTQVGARAAGMGGAFLAIPGDVTNLHYNPAGISDFSKRSASFTYLNDLLDINSGFIGFVQPEVGPGNLGVSILYKDFGQLDKTDASGSEIGTFGANSIALAGSYGYNISEQFSVGGNLKYIRASIDNFSADAYAFDAAAMYRISSQQLIFAAGLYNVGQAITAFVNEKDDLPMLFRAGFSKRLAHLPLLFGFQIYKYSDEDWYGAFGGEFTLSENFLLRLGYDSFGRDLGVESSNDRFAGAALGFGFLWSNLRVDYSYSSLGELGSLNRFTITGQF